MPFTLSHPIAVLIAPKSKYLHQSGLVIGSIAPDFIYYLDVWQANKFAHTISGAFMLALPLCFIIYYLYVYFIAPYVWRHLPTIMSLQSNEQPITSLRLSIIFCVSALIGIGSHVAFDWLLHGSSDILVTFDFIKPYHQGLRVYRWYSIAISLISLFIILLYLIITVNRQKQNDIFLTTTTIREKCGYWLLVSLIAATVFVIWYAINPVYFGINKLIVQMIDVLFMGLLSTGIIYRLYQKYELQTG